MLSWRNDQVLLWLKNSHYTEDILECFRIHNITGITLPMLNSEELKEMGIQSLKLRLHILNDINTLLLERNSTLNISHPLVSELQSVVISTYLIKNISKGIIDETSLQLTHNDESTSTAKKDYQSLVHKINKLREEVLPMLKDIQDNKPLPAPTPTNTQNTPQIKSPKRQSHRMPSSPSTDLQTSRPSPIRQRSNPTTYTPSTPSDDTLKQLRAKTEDPCFKILQAAMKSHKLDRSEWRKYVLVICYGGDKERVLRYDEKPVLVFKELNELGLSPSIMLRQVEDNDFTDIVNYEDYETPGGRL